MLLFIASSFAKCCLGADAFDTIPANSKLIADLKDIYRVYHVNLTIDDQKEMVNVYLNDENDEGLKKFLEECKAVCESFKQIRFSNDSLAHLVSQYLQSTIRSYGIAEAQGLNSDEFNTDYKLYTRAKMKYMSYIATNYPLSRFCDMSEKVYWRTIDKKNYITAKDYPRYLDLRDKNLNRALALLDTISRQTKDFGEYCIYQIELADQYVKHGDSLRLDTPVKATADTSDDIIDAPAELAIEKYKALLAQKKYSLYLFEAWLKWRTVLQENSGLSHYSNIPNDEYDKAREEAAAVVLDYISKNQHDDMAINEFLLFATHDIVRRFGDYPYGNQNTVEYHQLFDEKK